MKQFNLKGNEYYFKKEGNEITFTYKYLNKQLVGSRETKIDAEKLLAWLKEALTPKYMVVEGTEMYHVQIVESGETVTTFDKDMEDLNPKEEAYTLCARLNEVI